MAISRYGKELPQLLKRMRDGSIKAILPLVPAQLSKLLVWFRAIGPTRCLLVFLIPPHLFLCVWDIFHPDAFLRWDRAANRADAYLSFAGYNGDLWSFLAHHGLVGDYILQLALYGLGGRFLIILVQLSFMAIAVQCVYSLALLLTMRQSLAFSSALLFGLLPHNIVIPHVLSAEAVFIPLIVIAFRYLGEYCIRDRRPTYLMSSAAAFGFAAVVRILTFPWPFFEALALAFCRVPVKLIGIFLLIASAPFVAWSFFIYVHTGKFGEGSSGHDSAHNFYSRIQIMSEDLPATERADVRRRYLLGREKSGVSLRENLRFALEYPALNCRKAASELMVFTTKSGVEMLTVQYFDLLGSDRGQLQSTRTGWRTILEKQGINALAKQLVSKHADVMAISAFGFLVFTFLAACAALAMIEMLRNTPRFVLDRTAHNIALAFFPVFIFLSSLPIDFMQSRHRAPAEFVICIFAPVGFRNLIEKWRFARRGLARLTIHRPMHRAKRG